MNFQMHLSSLLQAIKYDIIRSVISRCEVLCDDILDAQEEGSQGKP